MTHLTSTDIPALKPFEREWEAIRDEARSIAQFMTPWVNEDLYTSGWHVAVFYVHRERVFGGWARHLPHCPVTMQVCDEVFEADELGLITASYSLFRPGARTTLHRNADRYALRAHLGLQIPKGDIGIRIEGRDHRWKEGEIFAWDPTDEHVAWNDTQEDRLIMIIDFFRPGHPREEMERLMAEIIGASKRRDPSQLGFTGRPTADGAASE